MAWIGISYWKDKLIIPNSATTTTGIGIPIAPVDIIDSKDKKGLIKVIRERIPKKEIIIPHPKQDEWKSIAHPSSQAVGYKSWKKFDKETKMQLGIGIREKDVVIGTYQKPTRGYEWIAKEDEQTINIKDPEIIAEYVIKEIEKIDKDE